jgi:transposase
MTRSYSDDLRIRVIGGISDGLSTRKAAKQYGIGISTAGTWYRRYLETGEVSARKQGKPPGSKLDDHEDFVLGLVKKQVDISLIEIVEALGSERAVSVCPSTVWYFLDKHGFSFKKNRARSRAGTA